MDEMNRPFFLRQTAIAAVEERVSNPVSAVEIWKGLASGTWALVDLFDQQGRRYYVVSRARRKASAIRALSAKEQKVWKCAARGLSDKQIAFRLGLSKSTVASYIAVIKKKVGVSSRTALIQLGLDLSLRSPESRPQENQGTTVFAAAP